MSTLAVLPDRQQQQIESLRQALAAAEEELRQERAKNAAGFEGIRDLRRALQPLFSALQKIYGAIEAVGGSSEPSTGADPRKRAVWEAWKTKMPGIPTKIIDALLLHGALTQTQLRIHAQCARSSVPNAVMQLNRAGLINKSADGKISLKEL
jgi:hypothetical protein